MGGLWHCFNHINEHPLEPPLPRFQIFLCDDAKNQSRLLRSALFLGLALSVHTGMPLGGDWMIIQLTLEIPGALWSGLLFDKSSSGACR